MSLDPMDQLRDICARLPEAAESVSVHHPSFKVRRKTFAMFVDGGDQPNLGPSGWLGAYVDQDVDWTEIAERLTDGYRLAAPKRLQALLDQV